MDHNDTALVVTSDCMPDSRARNAKGGVRGVFDGYGSINWERIYCVNCGTPYGYVPEETTTFAAWVCDKCAEKWGPELNKLMTPDVAFWAKVEEAMLEKYGRILSPKEIAMLAEASNDPLSKLIREGK